MLINPNIMLHHIPTGKQKKFLKIKEVAELFGVTPLTLRNWDKAGKLKAYRHPINNYRVYKPEDIELLLRKMESGKKMMLG